jgi:hypothetical protein
LSVDGCSFGRAARAWRRASCTSRTTRG